MHLQDAVLRIRDLFGWGPRKIHAMLRAEHSDLPSIRTIASILRRHDRIRPATHADQAELRFERAAPNLLWQCDFKGYLEIQGRRVYPFTVLDDHSRFLLAADPCLDQTMKTAWDALWKVFQQYGLPDEILCDHAFGDPNPRVRTLSWFEARLLRLGIHPCHGRPYHPQTQGKIERLHGTLEREVWPRIRRDDLDHFRSDLSSWRMNVYNSLRPHEALGDQPPLARWQPSRKPCPSSLPPVLYPLGSTLRRVASGGDISWKGYRILVGGGLVGELVRVQELTSELVLDYADYTIRRLPLSSLIKGPSL